MRKGHMSAEIVAMGQKVRRNGIGLSVTAITGLGGPELMEAHAVETAEAFNAMNPEYIGMLTLMVEPGTRCTTGSMTAASSSSASPRCWRRPGF